MIKRFYVIDTGYLVELFKVDGHFNQDSHQIIAQKFNAVNKIESDRIYVPISVLFELANHIAHVNNGGRRIKLASKLATIVKECVENENPWIIEPCEELKSVQNLYETLLKFSHEYSAQGLGLTDTSVLLIAEELRKKYDRSYLIHIWTTDRALKALEPDTEQNPFV